MAKIDLSRINNPALRLTMEDAFKQLMLAKGDVFYVDNSNGLSADTNDGKSWDTAFDTWDKAINMSTANHGDIILIAPKHAETIDAATDVIPDKAGITTIGLGYGADRPTFTFSTNVAANIPISGASTYIENILCVCNKDNVTAAITISAPDVTLKNVEIRDATDKEFDIGILTTADAERLTLENVFYNGFVTGDANTAAIRLIGVDGASIKNCKFLGNFGTAVIEFHTTANTNIVIDNMICLETDTTNLSKNVVATIGGNTWSATGFDIGAGCSFSGGSGAALAKDDVSALSAEIAANTAALALITTGQVVIQGAADAGTNSTTIIPILGLAGYGNDFFNNQFYMQVLCNKNSAGASPEKETRKITDYVSTTGTFTCDAFGAAVEATDLCLIIHESLVALGSNNNNNVYDSSTAVANADGSVIEMIKDLKAAITTVDDYIDTEVGLIKTETDKIPAEVIKTAAIKAKTDILPSNLTKTQTFVNTAAATIDLFTVTGTVEVELCAVVKTSVESAGGCNIKVDCGALAIIADSDCTTLEAADIWFANTPTTSVAALEPPLGSFALSPIKKFIVTNGQDITMTIEAAKQVDSGVIDYYVTWRAISADGSVTVA